MADLANGRSDRFFPTSVFKNADEAPDAASTRLLGAVQRLCTWLAGIDDQTLHRPLGEGRWSAAQTADHLVLSNAMFAVLITRACRGKPVHRQPPGELGPAGKPLSPPEAIPGPGRPADVLIADLRRTGGEVDEAVKRAGRSGLLDELCLGHAYFGDITVIECLQLAGWHVEHHLRQIEQAPHKG